MLRLGHIGYSNGLPVHALLVERALPPGLELVTGVPTELNAQLAAGRIDVAPASSIEYARRGGRYRLLPGLAIAATGAVGSILLESEAALAALDGAPVAVPTASATSVVLLRVLLERRLGVRPRYVRFDQDGGADPFAAGAAAALWIGDAALRRAEGTGRRLVDLGAAWREWTGFPFVFALWQTGAGAEKDEELRALHGLLLESRSYYEADVEGLAARHAARFGFEPDRLARYWRGLTFALDEALCAGLLHFFREAAALGVVARVPPLRWSPAADR